MFESIKKFFGFGKPEVKPQPTVQPVAPYKVETPVKEAPVVVAVDPTVNPVVSTTSEEVVIKSVPATAANAPKKPAPKKQGGAPKQPGTGKPRGRKPKAKPAAK